ncbi:MAG: 16S rRNA (cytidine(1402)-2'-O)-methyltransferase [Peptoniphilaceae bacterium]|uniref:16S rRNA (cytidine(1402)-2'-O)-methyltransferase n=1 Tax=Parvimonas sp. TaxID=1944660 RepID=UPI0025DC6371|nr:16S rRNA (cytidine(1402)-2'-O)-methyltransferase [Parvimonas sp.]MCI5996637.1 16S rRNA (cytidine(1402)-2'-O)-methyltransferase [Parvimonas sp.]MDD7765239.1 16S rRNA (cytidine(1402)-2'-O)-methyltransferase [Peptoniphilaceae bacterium]MDY3051321.1 16S rRNA (cytidine(1402)-2'-O)-methyltransferase [Parvimonas sp.]
MEKISNIYFVPTPIGNMKDITLRALEVLKNSDVIYCEDTRNSSNLLKFYNIDAKLISYHKFNENERVNEIIKSINEGKTVSIISDAGMPIINDPGFIILCEIIKKNISYEILPGACALINGLCGSGFDSTKFVYMGFVPKTKSEKEKYFENFKNMEVTGVFYESPHRLLKTLQFIEEKFGDINLCVCRELTKLFEEYKRGKVSEIISYYSEKGVRGEIVLVIEKIETVKENVDLITEISDLKVKGLSNKQIVKELKEKLQLSKNEIYTAVLEYDKEKE